MIMSAAKLRLAALTAFLAGSVVASPVQAALSYYVHISTIGGESTAPNHEGWIEALSFSADVSNPAMVGPGGATPGTSNLSSIFMMKSVDKASPKLAKAVATGVALGNVTLDVVDKVSGLPVYHIILRNAVLSSDQLSGSAAELPTESISIAFEAIEWTYTYQPSGSEVIAYWDRITVTGGAGPLPTPTPAMQQDSDNDGMPDSYEIDNGLNPLLNDANGDKDGDGASNLSEYLAGTRANDPNSVFRVHGVSRGDGTVLITWSSVANKTYSIGKSATPNGPFTPVQSGILSFEGETSRTVPFTGTSLFFRVTTP